MLCLGSWAVAPVPGYIAEEAWWDSPVDSEDEETPLHTQATAAEKMRDMGSFTKYFHTILLVHKWLRFPAPEAVTGKIQRDRAIHRKTVVMVQGKGGRSHLLK